MKGIIATPQLETNDSDLSMARWEVNGDDLCGSIHDVRFNCKPFGGK